MKRNNCHVSFNCYASGLNLCKCVEVYSYDSFVSFLLCFYNISFEEAEKIDKFL